MLIDIHLQDYGLAGRFEQKAGQIPGMFDRLRYKLVSIAENWVKSMAPVKTGKLRGNTKKVITGNGGYVFTPKSAVKYIDFVVNGTGPHIIRAKGSGALYWPGARHPVKSVRHPGTKANPFYDKAYIKIVGEMNTELRTFEKWLGEV